MDRDNKVRSRLRGFKRGATEVEFALSTVFFLLLTCGILGFGFATYAYNFCAYAAHDAARYAAVRGSTYMAPVSATDVKDFVVAEATGLNSSDLTVTTTWPSGSNAPSDTVEVTVQYKYDMFPLLNMAPVTMTSTSEMTITQ